MTEWIYQGKPLTDEQTEGFAAFVYNIQNLTNGRRYIGKKRLKTRRKQKPLKGKKRRRVLVADSDWKDYYGSNKELLTDVEKLGKNQFHREVLRLCRTLGESSYYEAKAQFDHDVLLNPAEWYNAWIYVKVRREHLRKGA